MIHKARSDDSYHQIQWVRAMKSMKWMICQMIEYLSEFSRRSCFVCVLKFPFLRHYDERTGSKRDKLCEAGWSKMFTERQLKNKQDFSQKSLACSVRIACSALRLDAGFDVRLELGFIVGADDALILDQIGASMSHQIANILWPQLYSMWWYIHWTTQRLRKWYHFPVELWPICRQWTIHYIHWRRGYCIDRNRHWAESNSFRRCRTFWWFHNSSAVPHRYLIRNM